MQNPKLPPSLLVSSAALLLVLAAGNARAAIDPDASALAWWDASRAERIDYSDRAAAACKPATCSSSEIRYCLNDTLKPPVLTQARSMTLATVTARCIAQQKTNR